MALSQQQIERLWVDQGGDPKVARLMAKIALRESGGRPKINNRGLNKNGTVDWGLFQVNDIWRKDPVVGPLFKSGKILTPEGAAKAAIRILKVQGPKAWATYKPGVDSKYLGGFSGATGDPEASEKARPKFERVTVPGVDRSADRQQVVWNYLQQSRYGRRGSLADLAAGLDATESTPDQTVTRTVESAGGSATPRVAAPRPTGGYAGTQGALRSLYETNKRGLDGLRVTSRKRANTNPYSGSRSDHDHGNRDAYAHDISNGSQPTPQMDEYAFRVARALGLKAYRKGTPINRTVTRDGVRYQVIYRGTGAAFGGNHLNHVHVGAKRVGR